MNLAIIAAMVIPVHFAVPVTTLFDMSQGMGMYWLRLGILLLLVVVYMILPYAKGYFGSGQRHGNDRVF